MNTEEKLSAFEAELNRIEDERVLSLTKLALSNVDDKFFSAPASSTGKYHPTYSLGEGGLVRHCKAIIWFIEQIFNLDQNNCENWSYERDLLISAAILHDSCKSGLKWENQYSVHEHPIIVKGLINNLDGDMQKVWDDIISIIESHMGEWNTSNSSSVVLPKPTTKLQRFFHMCDYLASRKQLDLNIWNQ